MAPLPAALLLVATACGTAGNGNASPSTRPPGRYSVLYRGLCDTLAHAGDVGVARRIFLDSAHQPLPAPCQENP